MVAIKGLVNRLFGGGREALDSQQTDEEDGIGEARVGQLKREFSEHPSKGLTPARLYRILEEAEQGHLKAQSELFEDMEEKDSQIGADLGKRRQLAAELEWQIVPPDNASAAERQAADQAAEVFSGFEVEDMILDLGTGIGHGWANLELPWARDGAMRHVEQPILRPHSWFRLHPDDQDVITLRDQSATGAALWPLGWIEHRHRAKPGYVARMGIHRMLAWPYLFQNYALGDLSKLLEIYGMPARVGKYPKNATDREKATLLKAVVAMGKDAAGIIPDGMSLEFMEAAGKSSSADVYKVMMDWCERAKAKAILGGTLTSGTGEGTNTNALGNVHERGQQSLIRSDVRQYAGSIQRFVLWPMAALNFGIEDRRRAPRFYLDLGETEDFKVLADTLPVFVDMGARVPRWWLHEKTRIPEAGEREEILQPKDAALAQPQPQPQAATTQRLAAAREALPPVRDVSEAQHERLQAEGDAALEPWVKQVRAQVEAAADLEDLRDRLAALGDALPLDDFAAVMTEALAAAHLAGRYDILEGA
ncbi:MULTISPECIES: DUF935 domain-containing protein [Halomonas]|uniref:Portal protein n=1 Tax=Halomonas halophila TaxID=29573 RepID=A0ABQ0U097_9GAMM|nr:MULTISPECIES: DUF935 domain-containing protein [Halomonas]MDR5889645.1 DUF935 domain-containing protein [Halomonas salina]WJY06327.1 DUF935 domain-containing protein [Halomonas halophila]GEK71586.1 hypothetical protein HHA04nite_01300 [Halomonas halophila]